MADPDSTLPIPVGKQQWPESIEERLRQERVHMASRPLKTHYQKCKKKSKAEKRIIRQARKNKKTAAEPAPLHAWVTYKEYLKTKWWQCKRRQKLRSVNGMCERCGSIATQAHHKHYRSLGKERNEDLEALCASCHERHHDSDIQAKKHLDAISCE